MPQSVAYRLLALAIVCPCASTVGALGTFPNGTITSPTGSYATASTVLETMEERIPLPEVSGNPPSEPTDYRASMLASMRETPLSLPTNLPSFYDIFVTDDFMDIAAVSSYFAFTPSISYFSANETLSASNPLSTSPTITSAPGPLCTLQNADPDRFIKLPQCICGNLTLSALSILPSAPVTAQCAYTSLPLSAQVSAVPKQVITSNCQVCTIMGIEEDTCSKVPGCNATSAAVVRASSAPNPSPSSPQSSGSAAQIFTNVTVAPSSIMIGYTQAALITAIGSQLTKQCPVANTTCDEYSTIEDVWSYIPGLNEVSIGNLDIKIPESLYTSSTQLAGMITLAVKAMSNSGSDCNTYDRKQGNCYGRRLVGGGTPCVNNYVNVCHFTDSVDVVVSNGASGLIAQMQIELEFDFPGKALECEEIVQLMELDAVAMVLFPALAPELVEIKEAMGLAEAWCNDVNKYVSWDTDGSERMKERRGIGGVGLKDVVFGPRV